MAGKILCPGCCLQEGGLVWGCFRPSTCSPVPGAAPPSPRPSGSGAGRRGLGRLMDWQGLTPQTVQKGRGTDVPIARGAPQRGCSRPLALETLRPPSLVLYVFARIRTMSTLVGNGAPHPSGGGHPRMVASQRLGRAPRISALGPERGGEWRPGRRTGPGSGLDARGDRPCPRLSGSAHTRHSRQRAEQRAGQEAEEAL